MAGSGGELVVTRGRGVRGGIWSEGRFGYLVEDRLPVQVGLIFDTAGWSSCRGDNTGPAGTFRPTSLGKRLPPNSQPPLLSLLSAASFSFSPSPPLVRPILASSSIVRDSISRRYPYRNPVRSVFPSFTSLVSSRATISRRQPSYCLLPLPLFQRDERLAPINILVSKRFFVAFGNVCGKHVHRYVVVFEMFCRTFGIGRVAIVPFAAYFFFHSDEQDRSDSFGKYSRSLYC